MAGKVEAFFQFLKAARSLADQGMSKEAIMQFAENQFGKISKEGLFYKQIQNIFKPKEGIENIKIKDPDFDDTVVKMQFDEFGPFNPKDPLKNVSKQTEPMRYRSPEEFDTRKQYEEYLDAVLGPPDDVFGSPLKDDLLKAWDKVKIENVTPKKTEGIENISKIKFRLNKERFKKDFNVTDEEVEKISLLSPEDQQKKVREYIDKDFKERIELSDYDVTDLEPNAEGGRAGHYTGGMVDVEPSLSDIGHGSDALMARTRLVSPNSQATTSTGLNYLLAEDNDNIRVPFAKGKLALADAARRKFMKAAGATGAGIAALKTGLIGLGEKAAPVVEKAVTTVSETAQSVPPYFFNLVKKIKNLGDETMASQDKAIAKKYKDYVMEEDFAGNITIIKKNMDDPYPEEVIMSYKVDDVDLPSGKGMAKVDEYEEFTVRPDRDGKMKDIEGGVPDEVVQEGTMFEDTITEFGKTKKASGGLAKMLGE